jgi:hypothetical protein
MFRYSRILEIKKGYANRDNPDEILKKRYYLGTPDHLYVRYSLEVPDYLKVGLTAEKDAGESMFFAPKEKSIGFDHYAGFIQKKYHFWLKELTVGDFQIHSGQGLVMGNRLITGKGTEPIRTAVSHDRGLRPYQGSTEYNFFRGVVVKFGQQRWSGTAFFSRKGMDASVDRQYVPEEEGVIRSILKTGHHRTPVEMEKKNAAQMNSVGIVYRYRSIDRRLNLGISGIWNKLSLPVRELARYYNQFDFSGRQQINAGLNYKYFRGKYSLFGECAFSLNGGIAFVQGIIANMSYMVETIFLIRHYGRQYYSLTGRSFGEYAVNTNEQGVYWGIRLRPIARVQIHLFFDLFRSPWLRNGVASPGMGYEWMIYFKYSTGLYAYMDLFYREEHKDKNFPVVYTPEYSIGVGSTRKIRLNYQYGSEKGIQVRSRLQGSHYSFGNNTSVGYAVIQDLGYKLSWGYLKAGVSYFQTEDYSTRQHAYEPDVLYYFSIPSFYGRGMRYFVLIKIKPAKRIDCWLKGGRYHFFDQDVVGNGLEEIAGNKKTEIRCQFRFKF